LVSAETTQVLFFLHVNMEAYINGIGNISPQNTYDNTLFLRDIVKHDSSFLKCVEPDYSMIIPKGRLPRRLGKSLKIGVASAALALKDAGINVPDAIITGTGMGMLADTERFLTTMIDNQEKFLNPTSFIQSTHNTIGAYIAVMLGCNKYNFTYVHGNLSFENALLNALVMLNEKPAENILVGGIDEITEQHHQIKTTNHKYKKGPANHLNLLEYETEGAIPGEGSIFFSLSTEKNKNTYASIQGLETHYKLKDQAECDEKILEFLTARDLTPEMVDLVILGPNGDKTSNTAHRNLQEGIFKATNQAYYKHLCGEYPTSIAFAVWLAANILKRKTTPEIIRLNRISPVIKPQNILIYNQDRNVNYSLILISKE